MTRMNNTVASLTPGVTCDIGCHGHQMIVTGNQSSQENPNSCGLCLCFLSSGRDFQCQQPQPVKEQCSDGSARVNRCAADQVSGAES